MIFRLRRLASVTVTPLQRASAEYSEISVKLRIDALAEKITRRARQRTQTDIHGSHPA